MDKRLYNALMELDRELDAYLAEHGIDVSAVSPQKVAFFCTTCGGVFHVALGGLRCSGCGEFVKVTWPDGRLLTVPELERFIDSLAA